ncbi:MAG: AMP-binding protein, partial [bacterium]|nr:AMP-binding protein [bacterium]
LFLPFVALAQLAEAADRQGTLPRTLREVITAGEALHATPALRRLFARLGHAALDNQYGPTESHVVTACPLAGAPRAWPALPPIGRPVANARIHLLDARLRPVGVGVTAELHIGGEALARGYWRRPALTAERFVPDPWSEEPGVRLYRTGDLARYRPDGTLEFVGRRDEQVKIRGYRIEPGEIEAVLAEHPAVAEAVVTVYARPARLVAFLVPRRRGDGRDPADVRRWLGARLPEHMIPADFIVLERLPLTASGKVDRRSLPAPAGASRDPGTPYVGPRSPVEEVVAEIWSEVLGAPDIGVRDDFFARGGHSLLAVRMMARIEARLGVHLPLATLFRRPTVEGLAAAVADPRPATRSPLVEIQPTGSGSRFFCVHPGGGNVLCYAGLARRLGMDQPFYGLQSRAQDGGKDRDEDVGSMAASYLKAIRAVQPQGPYLLGGWSMGGAVAFEMARRLRSAGQEVALLALIDAAVPPRPAARNREEEATNLVHFARHLGLPSSPALGRDAFLELGGDEGLRRILDQARQADLLPELDLPRMRYLYRRFTSHARAMRRYRPRPYPGKIVLFRPQARTAADSGDPTLGWSELAHDGVELCSVPGDHFTMLREPHVQVLAERLRPLLRNGQD